MKKTIVILSHVTFDDSPYCRFVHDHARELAKQGYRVVVLAAIHWLPILSCFQKYKQKFMRQNRKRVQTIDGVEVIYKKVLSVSNLLYNSKINLNGILYYFGVKNIIKKILKENDTVLIDAHTFKVEGYVAKKIKQKYGIFTTVTLHGTSFERNLKTKNGRKAIKDVFNAVDYAVCVSNKIQKSLIELNIKNSVVIYNGINMKSKIQKKQKFSIISVGNMIKSKNFDVTIKVVKDLSEIYKDIHLTIVGEGAEREKLEELVKKLKLEDTVDFTGYLNNDDVLDYMGKSEIFLMPSSPEGFGIVYAEAMHNKCITIGTKNEGIDGFIINGKNGFLVNTDEEEITNLIDKIYKNEYNLQNIRDNAYKTVEKLTWEQNAKNYLKLLKE